jgi:hypothetical protein
MIKNYVILEVNTRYPDDPPDIRFCMTSSTKKNAKERLEELIEENEKKRITEEKKGNTGWYNIYNDVTYIIGEWRLKK